MSAAQRLLAAAGRLRVLAETATPGPWWADDTEIYGHRDLPLNWVGETCAPDTPDGGAANGHYIAAMHPGVGEALATLLREFATNGWLNERFRPLLAVADAILGDTADVKPERGAPALYLDSGGAEELR